MGVGLHMGVGLRMGVGRGVGLGGGAKTKIPGSLKFLGRTLVDIHLEVAVFFYSM